MLFHEQGYKSAFPRPRLHPIWERDLWSHVVVKPWICCLVERHLSFPRQGVLSCLDSLWLIDLCHHLYSTRVNVSPAVCAQCMILGSAL